MAGWIGPGAITGARRSGGTFALIRRLIVLLFAVIQLILVARILVDVGVLPATGTLSEIVTSFSTALAAPVQQLGGGLGSLFGGAGGGLLGGGSLPGARIEPTILVALGGWTMVEALALRVVGKFATV